MEDTKGKTAYFVFCEVHRTSVREELLASKEEGAKIAVAEEAKALGQKWKQLTDEQRQEYKDVAAKNKQAEQEAKGANRAQAGGKDAGGNGEEGAAAEPLSAPAGLPLSVIRRIILCDKEVGRVSKDAAVLMGAAAEMFLGMLTEGCGDAAKNARPKRRTIKLDDFSHVIRSDRRLVSAGMKDVVGMVESIAAEHAAQQAEGRQATVDAKGDEAKDNGGTEGEDADANNQADGEKGSSKKGKGGSSKKVRIAPPPSNNPITSFFAHAPPPTTGNQ